MIIEYKYFPYVLLFLCLPVYVSSQWSTSPDSNLQVGVGEFPKIVSDGEGGCFIAWSIPSGVVQIQKIDKYGYVQWTANTPQGGVNAGGSGYDTCRTYASDENILAPDGLGGVYIAFTEFCCIFDCDGWGVYVGTVFVQHIDGEGNLLWGEGVTPTDLEDYTQDGAQIVTDGNNGIIIVFNSKDGEWGSWSIIAQRLDPWGNRLWEDGIQLSQGIVRKAVSDGNGGVVINWGSSRYQRLSNDGEKQWGEEGVFVPSGGFDLVVDPVGESVYVHNSGGILRVNRLSLADGTLQWDSLGVTIDTLILNSGINDFKIDGEGNLWIAWYHYQGESYLQKISPDGIPRFSLPGIPPSSFPSQKRRYKFESSIDSSMIVIWLDKRSGNWQFYGQRFKEEENPLWVEDVVVSELIGEADLATDTQGGVIITWWQLSDFCIYVQQLSVNGNLGEVLTSVVEGESSILPDIFTLFQNYPNPFNTETIIRYHLPKQMAINLVIYNIAGKEVVMLVDEKQDSGEYMVTFDGTSLSSGIYFYQLRSDWIQQTRKLVYLR